MRGLAIGSSGDDVARVFGPATQAAVLAFPRSEGLVDALRHALIEDDLKTARKLVNGGSHGLDRFTDAYEIGKRLIPEVVSAGATG